MKPKISLLFSFLSVFSLHFAAENQPQSGLENDMSKLFSQHFYVGTLQNRFFEESSNHEKDDCIIWRYERKACEHDIVRNHLSFCRVAAVHGLIIKFKEAVRSKESNDLEWLKAYASKEYAAEVDLGKEYLSRINEIIEFDDKNPEYGGMWHQGCKYPRCGENVCSIPYEAGDIAKIINKNPPKRKFSLITGEQTVLRAYLWNWGHHGTIVVGSEDGGHALCERLEGCLNIKRDEEFKEGDGANAIIATPDSTYWMLANPSDNKT